MELAPTMAPPKGKNFRHWARDEIKEHTWVTAFREHFNNREVIDWTQTTKCSTSERLITDNKSDLPEIWLDMYDKDRKINRRPSMFLILLMLLSCQHPITWEKIRKKKIDFLLFHSLGEFPCSCSCFSHHFQFKNS